MAQRHVPEKNLTFDKSGLRVAILPLPGFTTLTSETEFLMFRQFARDIRDLYQAFTYMILPEFAKAQVRAEPGIRYIFEGPFGIYQDSMVDTPASFLTLFNPRNGRYPIDIAITSRGTYGAILQRSLREARGGMSVPLVLDESMPADFGWGANPMIDWTELASRAISYSVVAHTFFDTEREKKVALSGCRRVLAVPLLKDLDKKMTALPYGFSSECVDKAVEGVVKKEKFTLFAGARLNLDKQWREIIDAYNRFFAFGRDVGIQVCCPANAKNPIRELVKTNEAIQIKAECPQEEFLREAAASHVVLNTSKVEGFSVGIAQQLYVGLVMILPKADWVKELLQDRYGDYPFLYDGGKMDQADALLRHVHENYEECKEQVKWVPEWLKEKYDSKAVCAPQMYENLKRLSKEDVKVDRFWSPQTVRIFKKVVKTMPDRFNFLDYIDKLVETSQMLPHRLNEPRLGRPSRWAVWAWLKGHGYRDTCTTEMPVFERIE